MLKHLPRSGMDFLLHIFNLSWTGLLFFLESNSIFSPHQAGFRPGRSTPDQILYLSQSISDGFNNPGRALGRSSLLLIFPKHLHCLAPCPFSINSFRLAQFFLYNRRACVGSLLRWRPHKELCFDWSAGRSTGVFLSIRANVRPPFQWILTKLISSPISSYSSLASVSFPLTFLGVTFDRTLSFSKHVS